MLQYITHGGDRCLGLEGGAGRKKREESFDEAAEHPLLSPDSIAVWPAH